MFDLEAATAAAERDFGAIISQLDGLAEQDWKTPVRCVGWQVTDLAVHVAGASRGQAGALRRAAAGITELARLDPPAEREPQALLAALRDGRTQLLAALRGLPAGALGGAVPLPFGLVPAPVALQIIPLEYGFHRNDLDWALGCEVPLAPDIASTLLGIVPGLLPMLAGGTPVSAAGLPPAAPVSFQLTAPASQWWLEYAGDAWSIAPGDGSAASQCGISGDDSAVALFVMGRIAAGHPGLTITDTGTASAFKTYFPGP
jgi:uncharacterized protein (TIGR03083 family)